VSIPLSTKPGTLVVCIDAAPCGITKRKLLVEGQIYTFRGWDDDAPVPDGVLLYEISPVYDKFGEVGWGRSRSRLAVLPRSLTSLLETKSIDDLISEDA